MDTTMIGDANQFAIEYELKEIWPPFGRVRLWIEGTWFGDIQRNMFLYHIGNSLYAMVTRNPSAVPCMYANAIDAPGDEELLTGVTWSWGDAFDDFIFVMYAVEADKAVNVLWALHPSRVSDFPGYPLSPHHARILYPVFDKVVTQFLRVLAIH